MSKAIYTVEIDRDNADIGKIEKFGNWTILRDGKFFARGHFADFGSETVIDEGDSIGWMDNNTLIHLLVEDSL